MDNAGYMKTTAKSLATRIGCYRHCRERSVGRKYIQEPLWGTVVRPQWPSGRSTTCRAAPPNSKCKIVCASRCGEAMLWEYPICPDIVFSTLVVVRPYVSSGGPNAAVSQHAAQRRPTQHARLLAHRVVEKHCAGSIPFVQKLNFQPLS